MGEFYNRSKNLGCKIIIQKCIQHIMKENLLSLSLQIHDFNIKKCVH